MPSRAGCVIVAWRHWSSVGAGARSSVEEARQRRRDRTGDTPARRLFD